jgi:hypothetical protein
MVLDANADAPRRNDPNVRYSLMFIRFLHSPFSYSPHSLSSLQQLPLSQEG